jgi:hypothetical protein
VENEDATQLEPRYKLGRRVAYPARCEVAVNLAILFHDRKFVLVEEVMERRQACWSERGLRSTMCCASPTIARSTSWTTCWSHLSYPIKQVVHQFRPTLRLGWHVAHRT